MRISTLIHDELVKRGITYDYSVWPVGVNKTLGLVQLADDKDGFVVRAMVNGVLKVPEGANFRISDCTLGEFAYPHLSKEEAEGLLLYQYIPVDIRIVAFEKGDVTEVPREVWYNSTDEVINQILEEKPELRTAVWL